MLVFVQLPILSAQVCRSWAIFGAVSERVAFTLGMAARRRRRVQRRRGRRRGRKEERKFGVVRRMLDGGGPFFNFFLRWFDRRRVVGDLWCGELVEFI